MKASEWCKNLLNGTRYLQYLLIHLVVMCGRGVLQWQSRIHTIQCYVSDLDFAVVAGEMSLVLATVIGLCAMTLPAIGVAGLKWYACAPCLASLLRMVS